MKGKMKLELLGIGQFKEFKYSGVQRGKLKLPEQIKIESGGDLIAVGEDEDYLHCFFTTGDYFGFYKSDDEDHIYQHILRLNT
jgi:hypothetical protein